MMTLSEKLLGMLRAPSYYSINTPAPRVPCAASSCSASACPTSALPSPYLCPRAARVVCVCVCVCVLPARQRSPQWCCGAAVLCMVW